MKIVYLSDIFNHHQKPLADFLYKETDGSFWFVETKKMPEERKILGYKEYDEPYIIRYSYETRDRVQNLIMDADAVICGEAPASLIKERLKKKRLTFRDDERRYKALIKYLKYPIYTYHSLTFNKCYLLCASAFGARDYLLSGMSRKKCFRWGYFSNIIKYPNVDELISQKNYKSKGVISLMWAGRFIPVKHPEMVIELAERLKKDSCNFIINLVGTGKLENELKQAVAQKELGDVVRFLGSMPPEKVRCNMEEADIFLITSDEGEGWGAVLNESMNSCCAVVASHAAGAVPYLVQDGVNGLIFKSKSINSLYTKVKSLVDNEELRERLGRNAYNSMIKIWNAETAGRNLLALIDAINTGKENPITEGPCSPAPIMNHTWMK